MDELRHLARLSINGLSGGHANERLTSTILPSLRCSFKLTDGIQQNGTPDMAETFNPLDPDNSPDLALRVLEAFAESAHITFDRSLARRALSEAEDAVPGNDAVAWSRRLVEVGESLDLRVRTVDCTLSEALLFVRQGIPVAVCEEQVDTVTEELSSLRWYVLSRMRGRRVGFLDIQQRSEHPVWLTPRALQRRLGLVSQAARIRIVIGQAALACQAPHGDDDHQHGHISPLSRLAGLVRPEKRDLWVVLIFSMVVGVLALASPVAVEALVNTVAFGRYLQPIVILAIMLFTFLAFAAAMRALITYIVEVLQRRLFVRVVEDLAYRLPRRATSRI